jgi:hypothetical protein
MKLITITFMFILSFNINSQITIKFNNYCLNWDESKGKLIQDSSYSSLSKQYFENKAKFFDSINISDTISLNISECFENKILKQTVLLLFIIEIENINHDKLFRSQFDSFTFNCFYPDLFVEYLNRDLPKNLNILKNSIISIEELPKNSN